MLDTRFIEKKIKELKCFFCIKTYFKIRHDFLKFMFDFGNEPLPYSTIKEKIENLADDDLLTNLQVLADEGEIIICDKSGINSTFKITFKGKKSLLEKKYLSLGHKELRERIFDILKIASTTILLLIAVYTFMMNIIETYNNKKEIEKLKNIISVHLKEPH